MRRCKHCGLAIAFAGRKNPGIREFWYALTRDPDPSEPRGSTECRVASWHAPYDVPGSLEPEQVEAWLAQPLVID